MSGTYEEMLPCGGKLKVVETSWEIFYYFSGPDYRYKGTTVSIPGKSIEQYISAFKDNWAEYEQLKASIPKGGEFTKTGKMGMSIRIGVDDYSTGVYLRSYYMPIRSAERLEIVIDGYRYAAQKVPQIQKLLASL